MLAHAYHSGDAEVRGGDRWLSGSSWASWPGLLEVAGQGDALPQTTNRTYLRKGHWKRASKRQTWAHRNSHPKLESVSIYSQLKIDSKTAKGSDGFKTHQ